MGYIKFRILEKTADYYKMSRPNISELVPTNILTILDIGCGEGAFLKLVKARTGAETWGIEVVSEIAEKAKQKVDMVLTGKIEDLCGSIPDGYFDCITFNDVLEHLIEPTEILKAIMPKLSLNGIIIASIPNVRHFQNLYELVIKKDWEYTEGGILDSTHLRFFTKKSMKRMFESAGYKVIKQIGINSPTSAKFKLLDLMTLGLLNETKYLQYVSIIMKI